MNESDVISQLRSLKTIEPNENWVVSVREEILTKAPFNDALNAYNEKPSKMDEIIYIYESISKKYKFVPSMATMCVILLAGSFIGVTAAKTSLPGDPLYSLKLVNENIVLAVTNDDDKPRVEMEIAGKRLEELSEISKKASDVQQQSKVEQLVKTFEEKVVSANEKMTKISQSSEKKNVAKVAKQINNQSEKYSELLAKTKDSLPTVVKDKVTVQIASALSTTAKANMDSLLILAENNQNASEKEVTDEELTDMIKKKVDEINSADAPVENGTGTSPESVEATDASGSQDTVDAGAAAAEVSTPIDAKSALMNSITENLNNNNLVDAVKGVAEIQKLEETQNTADASNNAATNDAAAEATVPAQTGTAIDPTTDSDVGESLDGKVNNVIIPVPVE